MQVLWCSHTNNWQRWQAGSAIREMSTRTQRVNAARSKFLGTGESRSSGSSLAVKAEPRNTAERVNVGLDMSEVKSGWGSAKVNTGKYKRDDKGFQDSRL